MGVAPVLVLVAIGAIAGNLLGRRLGDRFRYARVWAHEPCAGEIENDLLYGNGVRDKTAKMAPFVPAAEAFARSGE